MYIYEILPTFRAAIDSALSNSVVETFYGTAASIEGAIVEAYSVAGRLEEFARDQAEIAIRSSCGTDALLESDDLKAYVAMKKAAFSAMGYMYSVRSNEDLLDVAWEAFQIAHPSQPRDVFDRWRSGDQSVIELLKS